MTWSIGCRLGEHEMIRDGRSETKERELARTIYRCSLNQTAGDRMFINCNGVQKSRRYDTRRRASHGRFLGPCNGCQVQQSGEGFDGPGFGKEPYWFSAKRAQEHPPASSSAQLRVDIPADRALSSRRSVHFCSTRLDGRRPTTCSANSYPLVWRKFATLNPIHV
jgi:hypothetical protein